MADFTTEQVLPFTFKVMDGRGRVVATDGTPIAVSSDETVATVGPLTSDDGKVWAGEVSSVAPGSGRVSVTGDADLGEGVQEVVGVLDINVTLDERTGARIVQLEAGTPADKPL